MRVLEINSVIGIRSTGRITIEIAEQYQKKGHEVMIAFGREYVPEEYFPMAVRIGSEKEVRINALKARLFDNDGFTAKKATKRFLRWVQEYNPDILWLHNLHGYYINIELLFRWIKSRPEMKVFWLLHDCWSFTGHCSHYCAVNCEKWKDGCNKCIQKKEYPKSIFIDNSASNYVKKKKAFCGVKNMTLVTPCKWLAEEVKKGFLGKYNVIVRNNRINTDVFRPVKSDFKEKNHIRDKIMLLSVAQYWDNRKGLDFILNLASVLESQYKIVMVGLTRSQIRSLPSNILGIERTNSMKELAEIYTAADLFINPTFEDTFPTVNIEALACGTPVVTNDTGGSSEIAGNEYGRVVYSKTINEFKIAIADCLNADLTSEQCRLASMRFSKYTDCDDVLLS